MIASYSNPNSGLLWYFRKCAEPSSNSVSDAPYPARNLPGNGTVSFLFGGLLEDIDGGGGNCNDGPEGNG
jgi:hypothetical protein